ncbi:gliding motility-associated C-terminal domain-containing protein [Adhaeribacter terreus]|uniref:Gliding motility-associated C-terminal domain-containing protein n=1 Tax=Adhaeribacter terreus TaxID=529703 RepID=A0ABW0E907_9BACT
MTLRFLLLILFCSLTLTTNGQEKQGANWFIGGSYNNNGLPPFPGIHLDFNHPKISASQFLVNDLGIGAVATISDRKGKLLFFTRKGYVATRVKVNDEYQLMPNGNSPSFNPDADLIMQNPQDEQRYYIFSTWPSKHLVVREVDMRLNIGFGDVVANSLRVLKSGIGIGMAAMLHANNKDFWLITSGFSGDSLLAFPVNAAGIGVPVVSLINRNLDPMSCLKSSPNSQMLVTSGKQGIELFHFNRQTGSIVPQYSLTIPDSARQKGFSFSFSPSSSKLFVGTTYKPYYHNSAIVQFDLSSGNSQHIQQSAVTLFTDSSSRSRRICDMQLAINGKIYITRGDLNQDLSEISYPDQAGFSCGFKLQSIPLSGTAINLPALNQTLFRNVSKLQAQASRDTICYGDSVQLSAYGAGAEHFQWEIANGLTSPNDTLANPIVRPTTTTIYRVIASSPFRTDTAFVKVVVRKNPEMKLNGPEEVLTLAENQEYRVSGATPGSTLNWQVSGGEIVSGQGTNRIRVNWAEARSGTVSIVENNKNGCNYSESLTVKIAGSPPPVFYNIITPNGDKLNDAFVIQNLKWYAENELKIYNRWGVEVFRKRNYKNNWQAEELSSGVYFYRFQAGSQTWKGWLEVVK